MTDLPVGKERLFLPLIYKNRGDDINLLTNRLKRNEAGSEAVHKLRALPTTGRKGG